MDKVGESLDEQLAATALVSRLLYTIVNRLFENRVYTGRLAYLYHTTGKETQEHRQQLELIEELIGHIHANIAYGNLKHATRLICLLDRAILHMEAYLRRLPEL